MDWLTLDPAHPDLFTQLRELGPSEASVRFNHGIDDAGRVQVPASSLTLQGALRVEAGVDRFGILIPGWGENDFVWLARRRGRGRSDYWQGAIEQKPGGRPALIFYFTAELDGLEIRVRRIENAASSL